MKRLYLISLAVAGAMSAAATPWMGSLPDGKLVRQMSIPGTHDAATSSCSGISKCQTYTIAEQWDKGVRAFDLRPAGASTTLEIYHGSSNTKVTLQSVLDLLRQKLAEDPEDFAFILLKKENDNNDNNKTAWQGRMVELMQQYDDIIVPFYPDITLGEARGKIIALTRDAFDNYKIPHADNWGDNQAFKDGVIRYNGGTYSTKLQDNYSLSSSSDKAGVVTAMLDYSTSGHNLPVWVINYTSGYKNGLFGIASDLTGAAASGNTAMLNYLTDASKTKGRAGVVFMDYAGDQSSNIHGQDLIDSLIANNSALPDLTTAQAVSFFNNKDNWGIGTAATGVGTANMSGTTVVESYRDNAFGVGRVISATCEGLPDGDYIVDLTAHANWTPGRGSITSAQCNSGDKGYSRLMVNTSPVDLPITHSTGFPNPTHRYQVPAKVEGGKLSIYFENMRKAANWFTIYVHAISQTSEVADYKIHGNPALYFANPYNWTKGSNYAGNGPQHKDNVFVESWISPESAKNGNILSSTLTDIDNGDYMVGCYAFACRTGSQTKEDGVPGEATITINDTIVELPTYNTGAVPLPHAFYYIPTKVKDNKLHVSLDSYSYANWFGIDIAYIAPYDRESARVELPLQSPVSNYYGHKHDMFTATASVSPYSNAVKGSDDTVSPGEQFFENWNGTAFTGRMTGTLYVADGTYDISMMCMTDATDGLDKIYFFANDQRDNMTQTKVFENRKVTLTLPQSDTKTRAANAKLNRIDYGFAYDAPAQWFGIKKPALVKVTANTGMDETFIAATPADETIYNITGARVGHGDETLQSLAPGLYIYRGRKILK